MRGKGHPFSEVAAGERGAHVLSLEGGRDSEVRDDGIKG